MWRDSENAAKTSSVSKPPVYKKRTHWAPGTEPKGKSYRTLFGKGDSSSDESESESGGDRKKRKHKHSYSSDESESDSESDSDSDDDLSSSPPKSVPSPARYPRTAHCRLRCLACLRITSIHVTPSW